jgi:hypothetical protein
LPGHKIEKSIQLRDVDVVLIMDLQIFWHNLKFMSYSFLEIQLVHRRSRGVIDFVQFQSEISFAESVMPRKSQWSRIQQRLLNGTGLDEFDCAYNQMHCASNPDGSDVPTDENLLSSEISPEK